MNKNVNNHVVQKLHMSKLWEIRDQMEWSYSYILATYYVYAVHIAIYAS